MKYGSLWGGNALAQPNHVKDASSWGHHGYLATTLPR